MKLATDIHCTSAVHGHFAKRFQGQRSEVKVMSRPINL